MCREYSRKIRLVVCFLSLLVVSAFGIASCGQEDYNTLKSGQTVTLADQGKVFDMAEGDSFLLKLGDEYTWDISISDTNILRRVPNIAVVVGAQGIYRSYNPGTAFLTAIGDPVCRQSNPPCELPTIKFEITVNVI